jgi:hypothetical protein
MLDMLLKVKGIRAIKVCNIKGCLTARLLPEDKSYHMYKMTTVNVFIIYRIPIFTKFVEQQEAILKLKSFMNTGPEVYQILLNLLAAPPLSF